MTGGWPLARLGWMGVVGLAATGLYAALTWTLVAALAVPGPLASLAAYAVAAGVSYLGHRWLTFRGRDPHRGAVARFSALTLVGYGAALAIPALVAISGGRIEVSILITCLAVPALNYLVLSRLVFPASNQGRIDLRSRPLGA